MTVNPVLGAIEAGGTKFNVAIVSPDGEILARTRLRTLTPEETIGTGTMDKPLGMWTFADGD